MKKLLSVTGILALMLMASCGGGNSSDAEDTGHQEDSITEQAGTGQDENVCRVTMESIAMMILNEKGMSGSCPATLEDFQELNPAYAEFDITCGGTPYEYETDGENFTITCPNGHGSIHNDEATWSW